MIDYENLINSNGVHTSESLNALFWDVITSEWSKTYTVSFPKHGEITLQNFLGFAFLIDHIWPDIEEEDTNNELPETRVIGFFGISNTQVTKSNRSRMARSWGKSSEAFARYGSNYDKGHFIAHGFGGPVDVNIFPQRSDINRGIGEGKRYRDMERYVLGHPGTLVFSRPIYGDLTPCPYELEYGYVDKEWRLIVETFPNR